MITELTPEQEKQLSLYAEKWRKIGLCTDPANRQLDESLDLEGRLIREWQRQNDIFLHAKRHRIRSVMLLCLAKMNTIAHVLGYEPERGE